jgi:hypothetical protein
MVRLNWRRMHPLRAALATATAGPALPVVSDPVRAELNGLSGAVTAQIEMQLRESLAPWPRWVGR